MSEINLKYVHDLEWQNANFRVRIAALEEAGDELTDPVYWSETGDQFECVYCGGHELQRADVNHDPDCPVTLWNQAKIDKEKK